MPATHRKAASGTAKKALMCHSPAQAKVLLCTTVLPLWARLLTSAQAQSETAVAEMMAAFSEMTPLLERAAQAQAAQTLPSAEAGELPVLIERMLIGFQYQDRISQMLALLQEDMQRMQLALSAADDIAVDDVATLDASAWLQRMESQYAMAEQRRDHQALDGNASVGAAADETTFF